MIEAVERETYYDYVPKHVFDPAGMTSTSSPTETEEYRTVRSAIWGAVSSGQSGSPTRTGTLDAHLRRGRLFDGQGPRAFAYAHTNNRLLGADPTKLLTTGKVTMGPGASYAYGFVD